MRVRLLVVLSLLVLFVAGCGTVQPLQDLESQKNPERIAILTGIAAFPTVTGTATVSSGSNKGPMFQGRIKGATTLVGQILGVYVDTKLVTSMTIVTGGDGAFKIFGAPVQITEFFGTPLISLKTSTGVLVASGIMNF
jgi:hypothetical protein